MIQFGGDLIAAHQPNNLNELVQQGRQLDAIVKQMQLALGARVMERLFAVLGAVLIEPAEQTGKSPRREGDQSCF